MCEVRILLFVFKNQQVRILFYFILFFYRESAARERKVFGGGELKGLTFCFR